MNGAFHLAKQLWYLYNKLMFEGECSAFPLSRKEVTMAVVAYCVKCKAKKEMVDPQEGVTKNGRVITKGTCPDCGTKMSLIGGVAKK